MESLTSGNEIPDKRLKEENFFKYMFQMFKFYGEGNISDCAYVTIQSFIILKYLKENFISNKYTDLDEIIPIIYYLCINLYSDFPIKKRYLLSENLSTNLIAECELFVLKNCPFHTFDPSDNFVTLIYEKLGTEFSEDCLDRVILWFAKFEDMKMNSCKLSEEILSQIRDFAKYGTIPNDVETKDEQEMNILRDRLKIYFGIENNSYELEITKQFACVEISEDIEIMPPPPGIYQN